MPATRSVLSPARPGPGAAIRGWGRRHAYSLLSSLGSLLRQPLAAAMTVIVLAIALSLPVALYSTLSNLQQVGANWERLDAVTVFLEPSLGADAARDTAAKIETWEEVAAVALISPEQALVDLGGEAGLGEAVAALEENPLPWVIEVSPVSLPEDTLNQFSRRLEAVAGVDLVLVDLRWLHRLDNLLALIHRTVQLLALLFALAVVFVIGNTIRLDIHNRREEIEVMALVGATDSFIRRPFLYAGLWYGLLGGILAWLMVRVGLILLHGPVTSLAISYDSQFQLTPPETPVVALLIAGSGVLGLAGAWLAVNRHLRRIAIH